MYWIIPIIVLLVILFIVWLIFGESTCNTCWKANIDKITIPDSSTLSVTEVKSEEQGVIEVEMKEEEQENKDICPKEHVEPKYSSRGEKETCEAAERIFGKPFYKLRPNFLKSPLTGRNLEIDCINEELKIAIERNGIQHYVWPNYLNMTREQFEAQLQRDQFKAERLEALGYYFIVVPYTVPIDQIEAYILERKP